MWAVVFDQADLASAVAECDQVLAEQHHPHRIAIWLGQFTGQQRWQPVLAHQGAHRGARADPADGLVVDLAQHRSSPVLITLYRIPGRWARGDGLIADANRAEGALVIGLGRQPTEHELAPREREVLRLRFGSTASTNGRCWKPAPRENCSRSADQTGSSPKATRPLKRCWRLACSGWRWAP